MIVDRYGDPGHVFCISLISRNKAGEIFEQTRVVLHEITLGLG